MSMAASVHSQPADSASHVEHISNALNATLDPRASNNLRQEALQHLESWKAHRDAPEWGYNLAADRIQSNAVRHYGLQLLEFAIRYKWNHYSEPQAAQVRLWVTSLAGSLHEQDAPYFRNKVGQLWVELAKRCWGDGEWMDMDALLLDLWERESGVVDKLLVLYILEMLSEDIINSEDTVAGLRMDVLGNALNEIMVPSGMYKQLALVKGNRQAVRCGEEGWLSRMCNFFSFCVKQARVVESQPDDVRSMEMCAIKALHALRPTMNWISLKGAEEVNSVDCLFLPFHTSNVALQIAAVDVLNALLGRPHNQTFHEAWLVLFRQAMQLNQVALIRRAFEQTTTRPGGDEEHYTLQKKMAELLSIYADSIAHHHELVDNSLDLPSLFHLLILVVQHRSLTVSIPVLHSWTKLINVQDAKALDLVGDLLDSALSTLLQLCGERLVRYESLPEDTEDDILIFLQEDFDTVPERHAFLGNYRRYCTLIVQSIARIRPIDALSIVLGQMQSLLDSGPYTAGHGFDPSTYDKTSLSVLRFDAVFNVVMGTLKGYSAWMQDAADITPDQPLYLQVQRDQQQASAALQDWCTLICGIHTDDPGVADQVLSTLVAVLKALKAPSQAFVLQMVQHLLTMRLYDQPQYAMFSDGVKAFEALRVIELQKLALAFPTMLFEIYQELEPRINVLVTKYQNDPRLVWGYKAFLFMIVHRVPGIPNDARMVHLEQILKPTYELWMDPNLQSSCADMESFLNLVGMGDLGDFYKFHGFDRIQDWSNQQLNEGGQARQAEIKEKADRLPLRMTKTMLSATTEKLKSGSDEYENACALWSNLIPSILPAMLHMTRHAQAFHNMATWSQLPGDLQTVYRRTLQDRFWQSGISNESKEEFYARISSSKSSYEGFASTIRGTVRNIREMCYHIIYLMTKFEEQFFSIDNLAVHLADVLFTDAGHLGANHLHPLINLTTGLVQRCPPHYRTSFLPPMLRALFTTLDKKISAEWSTLTQGAEENKHEDDELSDEMRTESVLRQLTYSMVSFVPFLLEYDHQAAPQTNGASGHGPAAAKPSMSDLVLSDVSILEPLVVFCKNALRMRDGRCCSTICKALRWLVPLFAHTEQTTSPIPPEAAAPVREYISNEVLRACIISLNEPYFAELQKDLAALIANIILLYSPKTNTPRDNLLSLPDMTPEKIDRAIARIGKFANERQQRSEVLHLLQDVRGVSIHEMGKVEQAKANAKKKDLGKMQQYTVEQKPLTTGGGDEGLDGVAGMFDNA